MVAKRKLENDKQMGERNLVGFTLLDAETERQVRRYNKAQSLSNVNSFYGVTSKIRVMFLLFPQVSPN